MTATRTDTRIDWHTIAIERTEDLHVFAADNQVRFGAPEAANLVALTLRRDADAALAEAKALTATRPPVPTVRPGTITAVGLIELALPGGPHVLLRLGDQAWLVPDMPNGWQHREPWPGDINMVRWMGGPPAVAVFRRVGAL